MKKITIYLLIGASMISLTWSQMIAFAATPAFWVESSQSEKDYHYSTDDNLTIRDYLTLTNVDESRGMTIELVAEIEDGVGLITLDDALVELNPSEVKTVNFSISLTDNICSGTYAGLITGYLNNYDGDEQSGGLNVRIGVAEKIELEIESDKDCSEQTSSQELAESEPSSLYGNLISDGGSSSGGGGPSAVYKALISAIAKADSENEEVEVIPESYVCGAEAAFVENTPFQDISGHYGEYAISKLYNLSVVEGYSRSQYKPDQPITRAEFLKITLKVLSCEIDDEFYDGTFEDVEKDIWYYHYIEIAYLNGVVNGYDDGYFRPNQAITRAEALKILLLANGVELQKATGELFDDVELDDWFADHTETAAALNVVKGYDGTRLFGPNDPITRAQAAMIIVNLGCNQGMRCALSGP